jgi:hypothetical protein
MFMPSTTMMMSSAPPQASSIQFRYGLCEKLKMETVRFAVGWSRFFRSG